MTFTAGASFEGSDMLQHAGRQSVSHTSWSQIARTGNGDAHRVRSQVVGLVTLRTGVKLGADAVVAHDVLAVANTVGTQD